MKKFYFFIILLLAMNIAAEAKSIKLINISTKFLCPDKVYPVKFKPEGYSPGTELKIYLSESDGTFNFGGYSEGSVTIINNDTSTINLTVPKATQAGTNYKIVMVGEGIYSDTITGITIYSLPNPVWYQADSVICDNGEHTYSVDSSIPTVSWSILDGVENTDYVITQQSLTYQRKIKWLTSSSTGRRIKVTLTNSNGCSESMICTVKINPIIATFSTEATAACAGTTATYEMSDQSYNYTWTIIGGYEGFEYVIKENTYSYRRKIEWRGAGTYKVIAKATNGTCTGADTSVVIVPQVAAKYRTYATQYVFCEGTGGPVLVTGSQIGYKYELMKRDADGNYQGTGIYLDGTGGALSFANQPAGTYKVRAIEQVSGMGCSVMMYDSVIFIDKPSPAVFPIKGGGAYCEGGAGVPVWLEDSESGITYQLYLNGSPVTGKTRNGDNDSLSFGNFTATGTYTIKAKDPQSGCESTMSGTAVVTFTNLTAYNVTGGGDYCDGDPGKNVSLSGSELGVSYQLYKNGSPIGSPVTGTGNAISFGNQTEGSYTVVASVTSCTRNMNGTVSVTKRAKPANRQVLASGEYCEGESGKTVQVSNSESGVTYKLYKNGTLLTTLVSSGGALSFGSQLEGDYTVLASNPGGCDTWMSDTVKIRKIGLPQQFNVASSGSYCQGGDGIEVTLSGSQAGVTYYLFKDGSDAGSNKTGTGSALTFGKRLQGTYTIKAVNSSGCSAWMNGSAVITVNPLPSEFSISPTGTQNYCQGSDSIEIKLLNSELTVDYYLYKNDVELAIPPKAGTGSAISFGKFSAGRYKIKGKISAGCERWMAGEVEIIVNPLPNKYALSASPTSYCEGENGVTLTLQQTQTGAAYQLYKNGAASGSSVPGSGSSITYNNIKAGVYWVKATSANGCSINMADTVTVTENPLPTAFNVIGGGGYCKGGAGLEIKLNGSQTGVSYQLKKNGSSQGAPVAGNGSSISFGLQTVGVYTVEAINSTTGCSSAMNGSATIEEWALPVASITGKTSACENESVVYSSNSAPNYSWTVISGGSIQGSGSSQNVSIKWTTNPGKIRLIQTNASGCADTATMDVAVNPLPNPVVTGSVTVCENAVETYSSNSAATYDWSVLSGGAIQGSGSSQNVSIKWTSNPGKIRLIQTNTFGCADTATLDVTVNPLPVASITGGATACENSTLTYSSNSASTYSWTALSGGAIQGSNSSQTVSIKWTTNPGKLRLIQTNTTGCADTATLDVTVNPLPVATITGKNEVCVNEIASYSSNASSGNQWKVISGGVQQGGSNSQSYSVKWTSNPGKIELILTNPTGCADTVVYDVTVNPLPSPTITGDNSVCANSTEIYTSNSAASYKWTAVGGVIRGSDNSSTVTVNWTGTAGSLKLVQTNASGCSDSVTINVTINPAPEAEITGNFITCQNSVEFYTGGSASTYKWIVEGGSLLSADNLQNAQVRWQSSNGKLTLIQTNSFGCADTVVKNIIINPKPDVSITGEVTACENTVLNYESSLTGGAYSYEWTSSNGQIITGQGTSQIAVQWNTAGAGKVQIIIVNSATGCRDTAEIPVVVNPLPNVTINGPGEICSKQEATYQTTLDATVFNLNWIVVSGGVAKSANGSSQLTVAWNASGVGQLKLVATNKLTGCKDSLIKTVIINPTPTANITGASEACAGSTEAYSTNSGAGLNFKWSATGGTIVSGGSTPTVSVRWTNPGSQEIKVVVENASTGCRDSATRRITINPLPTPQIAGATATCGGSVELYYRKNAAPGSVEWKVVGGSPIGATNADTLRVRWNGSGTAKLTLVETALNTGCRDSAVVDVKINPLPAPEITGENAVCAETFANYRTNSVTGNSYSWQIEGGVIQGAADQPSIKVQWGSAGLGKLIVTEKTIASGCSGSDTLAVTVRPNPAPVISGIDTVCLECLENYYGNKPDLTNNSWRVEGGEFTTPTTGENVTVRWKTLGKAKLSLIQTNEFGCVDTAIKEIFVIEAPKVILSGDTEVCEGSTSRYSTTSAGDVVNVWQVSGGKVVGASGGYYVDVLWDAAGNGKVTLVQTFTNKGYVDSVTKTVTVNPKPSSEIQGSVETCLNSLETYRSVGSFASVQWTALYGGTIEGSSQSQDVKVRWTSNGVGKLSLEVISANGCRDTSAIDIIINSVPASQILGAPVACAYSTNVYHVKPKQAGLSYEWSVEGGVIDDMDKNRDTVEVAWNGSGVGVVRLVRRSDKGCADTARIDVTIYPQPVVTLAPMPDVCVDAAPFKLTGGKPEGGRYAGKGVTLNGYYDPEKAGVGIDTLTYLYVDLNKCSNSSKQVVRVLPAPPKPTIIQVAENLVSSADEGNQWLKDGVSIPGAINKVYTPTTTAYYSVYVTAQGGCVSDTSDPYYFEPGNEGPQIQTTPGVSFGRLLCENTATRDVLIENLGVRTLVISKAEITGENAKEFCLVTDLKNVKIEPKKSITAQVSFTPTSLNPMKANLEITSNAKNSPFRIIPLMGVKDSSGVDFSTKSIEFNDVPAGQTVEKNVTVRNVGTVPYYASLPGNLSEFEIISPQPILLAPGDSAVVTVRFIGNANAKGVSEKLIFRDSCGREKYVYITADVKSAATATLRVSPATGKPGDIVTIPITVDNINNFKENGITEIRADLEMTASVLEPVEPGHVCRFVNNKRLFPIKIAIKGDGTQTYNVQALAMLGTDTLSSLNLLNVETIGGNGDVTVVNSEFKLEGVCREGGARLVTVKGDLTLAVMPNPVSDVCKIELELAERGSTKLHLANSIGQVVRKLMDYEAPKGKQTLVVDFNGLASGVYFLVLETPTAKKTVEIQIVK